MVKAQGNLAKSSNVQNLRFERKFIFQNVDFDDIVQRVFAHSYCFKEVFQRRSVNNIYFDDYNYSFYKQNVAGVGNREKYRLRWYGDDFIHIKDPTFEIKLKYGEVGDKISNKIKGFEAFLSESHSSRERIYSEIFDNIQETNNIFKSKQGQLQPTLYNLYERRYYISFCQKFRITIDYNQKFFDPKSVNFLLSKQTIDEREIVLELKYNIEDDCEARNITQEFETRLTKNSKYVNGIERINFLNE